MASKHERARRRRDAHAEMETNRQKVLLEVEKKHKERESRIVLGFHLLIMSTLTVFFMWLVIQLLEFWGVV